jgi:hypothetical protein
MGRARLTGSGWWELHVQIPRELRDEVFDAARARDLTPTQWMRRAIREKLERDGCKSPGAG